MTRYKIDFRSNDRRGKWHTVIASFETVEEAQTEARRLGFTSSQWMEYRIRKVKI